VEILFAHNARIYVAARSEEKANAAITAIKAKYPYSTGDLIFLKLDLNDLTTIKASAEKFLGKETRLDVLWNNAGVMIPPQGSKTKQGYELQLGTNCIAPQLFTKFLTPTLVETAKTLPPGSVRVVWVASSAAAKLSPDQGVDMKNLDYKRDQGAWHKYGVSKAGNILQAKAYANRVKSDGIISVVR
jgi:retinol dehydrogenase-12